MNIVALVKQVADTAQLSKTVNGLQLMKEGGPRIVNPWDEYALETAIQLKEAHGGKVTALCLGKPEAVGALRTALAMGADEAILVSDPAMLNSDSLVTARIITAAIKKLGSVDIIVGGFCSIDGNSAATTVQIAALLGIPHISYVAELQNVDPDAGTLTAIRLLENGRETIRTGLPIVFTVVKEICEPRYPSFIRIRKASKADIPTWDLGDLGLESDQVGTAGSQVKWPEITLPPARESTLERIEGTPEEAAAILVDRLIAAKVV